MFISMDDPCSYLFHNECYIPTDACSGNNTGFSRWCSCVAWKQVPGCEKPSKEVILIVKGRINLTGRHLITNLNWLTAVSGVAINVYRFNSIGFKLGHTAIKSAKLVGSSLTAFRSSCLVSSCYFAVRAATSGTREGAAPFQLKVHNRQRLANIPNSDMLSLSGWLILRVCIIKLKPTITDKSPSASSYTLPIRLATLNTVWGDFTVHSYRAEGAKMKNYNESWKKDLFSKWKRAIESIQVFTAMNYHCTLHWGMHASVILLLNSYSANSTQRQRQLRVANCCSNTHGLCLSSLCEWIRR